jgi:hypothetical protein
MQNIQPLEFPIGLVKKIADYGIELIFFIDRHGMTGVRNDP